MKKNRKSVAGRKQQILNHNTYSPVEVAQILKKHKTTILRWCETGELQAIPQPYGDSGRMTYLIPKSALEFWKAQQKEKMVIERPIALTNSKPSKQVERFTDWCLDKDFSPRTIEAYVWHINKFFQHFEYLTAETVADHMQTIPRVQQPTREKFHRAAVCFAKFLIQRGLLVADDLPRIQALRPPKKKNPIRQVVTRKQAKTILEEAKNLSTLNYALVCVFLTTGIRNSELCNLRLQDLDLEQGMARVYGKGGKWRPVGLCTLASEAIKAWLKVRSSDLPWLFINSDGKQCDRRSVYTRIKKLSAKVGVPGHPHAFRRAFLTMWLEDGGSLSVGSESMGHARVSVTDIYNHVSQEEVIRQMRLKVWKF